MRGPDPQQGVAFCWSPALPLVQRFGGLGVRPDRPVRPDAPPAHQWRRQDPRMVLISIRLSSGPRIHPHGFHETPEQVAAGSSLDPHVRSRILAQNPVASLSRLEPRRPK